jgi:membrane-bound ClpP family serine protease
VLSHDDVATPVVDAVSEALIWAQWALVAVGVVGVVGVVVGVVGGVLLLSTATCVLVCPPPPHAAMVTVKQTAANHLS